MAILEILGGLWLLANVVHMVRTYWQNGGPST